MKHLILIAALSACTLVASAASSMQVDDAQPTAGAVENLTVQAAPLGAMEATVTWTWPTLNSDGGAQQPLTGAKIYRGKARTFVPKNATLVGTLTTGGQPGEQATWTHTGITEAGQYYYKVVPEDAAGASTESPAYAQSDWIGPDTGVAAPEAAGAVDPDNNKKIIITIAEPKGSNGGYINSANVTYQIVRTANSSNTKVTLEDSWAPGPDRKYTDIVPGLDSYTYKIKSVYNGSTSSSVTVGPFTAGGIGEITAIPYSQNFESAGALSLYTLFHGDECKRDWALSSKALGFWEVTTADAWAVTPKLDLQPGKSYKLSYKSRIETSDEADQKNLYIYTGSEPTAEALTNQIYHELVTSNTYQQHEVTFNVKNGPAYIAVRCYGQSSNKEVYVDDLLIEEVETVPASVAGIKAEADGEGALGVTLSWANPSEDTAGAPLTAIDRVEIRDADGNVKGKVMSPSLASSSTAHIAVEESGRYRYNVVVACGEKESAPVAVLTPWIGPDTPVAPDGLGVALNSGVLSFSWNPVTEGVEGGYINPEEVSYTIRRNDDVAVSALKQTTWNDTYNAGNTSYTLTALHAGKESAPKTFDLSVATGVSQIEAEDYDPEAQYYTLQGYRIAAERLVPGIYVRVKANETRKVIIR